MRQARRRSPSRDECATGTDSLRLHVALPPHTHICMPTVRSFLKSIKTGRRAPRATQTHHYLRRLIPVTTLVLGFHLMNIHNIPSIVLIYLDIRLYCNTYPPIYMRMDKYYRHYTLKRLRFGIGKYLLSPSSRHLSAF